MNLPAPSFSWTDSPVTRGLPNFVRTCRIHIPQESASLDRGTQADPDIVARFALNEMKRLSIDIDDAPALIIQNPFAGMFGGANMDFLRGRLKSEADYQTILDKYGDATHNWWLDAFTICKKYGLRFSVVCTDVHGYPLEFTRYHPVARMFRRERGEDWNIEVDWYEGVKSGFLAVQTNFLHQTLDRALLDVYGSIPFVNYLDHACRSSSQRFNSPEFYHGGRNRVDPADPMDHFIKASNRLEENIGAGPTYGWCRKVSEPTTMGGLQSRHAMDTWNIAFLDQCVSAGGSVINFNPYATHEEDIFFAGAYSNAYHRYEKGIRRTPQVYDLTPELNEETDNNPTARELFLQRHRVAPELFADIFNGPCPDWLKDG